jgi:hypothetical protein
MLMAVVPRSTAIETYAQHQPQDPAILLVNALVMPVFRGSVISVVTFWARSVSSLVCAVIASNCLRDARSTGQRAPTGTSPPSVYRRSQRRR